ncbi:MAG: hypothetical protein WBP26_04700 [Candidatus Saccharimonadales bacterium]
MAKQKGRISLKQVMIDKNNSNMVAIAAIAAFITVFSLVASKSLVDKMLYQNRVTEKKETALQVLSENVNAVDKLSKSYDNFASSDTNILEGSALITGNNNGKNTTIITDALPYRYDFPALVTSLERMMIADNVTISDISGTDDEVQQQANAGSVNPEPVAMPFEIRGMAKYADTQRLIVDLQRSIRPFVVQKLNISTGGAGAEEADTTNIAITGETYYQPGKKFEITTEVIK